MRKTTAHRVTSTVWAMSNVRAPRCPQKRNRGSTALGVTTLRVKSLQPGELARPRRTKSLDPRKRQSFARAPRQQRHRTPQRSCLRMHQLVHAMCPQSLHTAAASLCARPLMIGGATLVACPRGAASASALLPEAGVPAGRPPAADPLAVANAGYRILLARLACEDQLIAGTPFTRTTVGCRCAPAVCGSWNRTLPSCPWGSRRKNSPICTPSPWGTCL